MVWITKRLQSVMLSVNWESSLSCTSGSGSGMCSSKNHRLYLCNTFHYRILTAPTTFIISKWDLIRSPFHYRCNERLGFLKCVLLSIFWQCVCLTGAAFKESELAVVQEGPLLSFCSRPVIWANDVTVHSLSLAGLVSLFCFLSLYSALCLKRELYTHAN